MSEIADFINAQYDKREAIARRSASLQADPENGWGIDGRAITPHIGVVHEDNPREHIALNYPAFVLADIQSKRRILDEVVDEATSLDMSVDGDRRVGPRDTDTEPYLGDVLLRLLAAPFSGEPGYDERWAV